MNSLYRHNFANNNNNQFLNKKESLYDELFVNKNNSYLLTEEDKPQKTKPVNNSVDKRVANTNKSQTARRNNKYEYHTYKKGSVKRKMNNNANGGDMGQKYSKVKFATNMHKKARLVNYPKRSPFIANKF